MKKLSLLFILFIVLLTSCKKDPVETNDEELITTVQLDFIDGTTIKSFIFEDLDGDGGDAPVFTIDSLDAQTTYELDLFLLNGTEVPAELINLEIIEEDDEHQFFFTPSSTLNLDVAYTDQDGDGNPIGLENTATTGAASSGTLTVVLKHQPDKNAAGVASGDGTNAGGETDVEVVFEILIK